MDQLNNDTIFSNKELMKKREQWKKLINGVLVRIKEKRMR